MTLVKYVVNYIEGNTSGPFDIYLSGSSGLSIYATNVDKSVLETGYVVQFDSTVASSSAIISNKAYGCANEEQLFFPTPTPTITPTISVSPTRPPSLSLTPTTTPSITPTISISPTRTPSISVSPFGTPSMSATATPSISISKTPSLSPGASMSTTPSPTPSISITPSPTIGYKTLQLSNPPGNNTIFDTCTITSGLTYYYNPGWVITNGLRIYTDSALTNRLYTSNPLAAGYYVWLKDTLTGLTYAVTFDNNGDINTVYDCSAVPSPSISRTPSITPSLASPISVEALSSSWDPDQYFNGYITLSANVSTTTTFNITVSTLSNGTFSFDVVVPAGSNIGTGLSSQYSLGVTPAITNTCINTCDNPSIILFGFLCSV